MDAGRHVAEVVGGLFVARLGFARLIADAVEIAGESAKAFNTEQARRRHVKATAAFRAAFPDLAEFERGL